MEKTRWNITIKKWVNQLCPWPCSIANIIPLRWNIPNYMVIVMLIQSYTNTYNPICGTIMGWIIMGWYITQNTIIIPTTPMITKWEYHPYISLGIFPTHHPYCGWLQNPAPVENGGLSKNLKGFNHPRWCGISSNHSIRLGWIKMGW